MATVRRKLIGHYNYYGITDNTISIMKYYYSVIHLLLKWLNRRSQRRSYQTKEETNYHNTFQKTDEENLFSAARY